MSRPGGGSPIDWVWDRSEAKGTDRLVLLAIATWADRGTGKNAWPAIETIAEMTNLSPRQVKRAIEHLSTGRDAYLDRQGKGMEYPIELRVELNAGGEADFRGDRRPNRYTILLAHKPDRTKRAQRKAARHGVSTVSPRAEIGNDTDVFPQVSDTAAMAHEDGVSTATPRSAERGVARDTSLDEHGVTRETTRGVNRDIHGVSTATPNQELDLPLDQEIPQTPAERGLATRRSIGTNPRAQGTAPRDVGTNPRAAAVDALLGDAIPAEVDDLEFFVPVAESIEHAWSHLGGKR